MDPHTRINLLLLPISREVSQLSIYKVYSDDFFRAKIPFSVELTVPVMNHQSTIKYIVYRKICM